ncbi:unnamed protein product [Gadus morhua 'NCC']
MVPGLRQNLSLQGWMQSQPEEAECFPLRREVGVYNSSVRFNGSHSIFPVTLSEKENEPKGHRGTPLSSLSGAHRRQPGRATPAKTTVPRLEL